MADLLGKEAALWVPTCGMANLVALLTIAPRGRIVVLEASSHVLTSEEMGIEEIAGLEPQSLWAADGRLDPRGGGADRRDRREDARAREHAHEGGRHRPHARADDRARRSGAQRHGAYVHLDEARLFNAAVALGIPVSKLAAPANTVAVSLNKGCARRWGRSSRAARK